METTGLVLQMYRAHYGQIPLRIDRDFGLCDVVAALTKDGRTLTIGVMNPTDSEIEVDRALSGAAVTDTATRWHITGPDHRAHNTPGKPRVEDIRRTDSISTATALRVPALSSTLLVAPID